MHGVSECREAWTLHEHDLEITGPTCSRFWCPQFCKCWGGMRREDPWPVFTQDPYLMTTATPLCMCRQTNKCRRSYEGIRYTDLTSFRWGLLQGGWGPSPAAPPPGAVPPATPTQHHGSPGTACGWASLRYKREKRLRDFPDPRKDMTEQVDCVFLEVYRC